MSDQPEQSFGSFEPSAVNTGGNSFIPIAVALVGAVLGVVAIVLTLSRSGPSAEVTGELASLRETNAALTARIGELEQTQAQSTQNGVRALQEVQNLARSTQGVLDQIGSSMRQTNQSLSVNSEKIADIVKTLNDWTARGSVPVAARSAAVTSGQSGRGAAPAAVTGAGGAAAIAREHTIQSGDTFTALAKRYNVSTSAIIEANPDVDPRRLMLGQKIRIPAP